MNELKIGQKVRIESDPSTYTHGMYRGASGVITSTSTICFHSTPPVTLYFVSTNYFPLDDHAIGGWWYFGDEISLIQG